MNNANEKIIVENIYKSKTEEEITEAVNLVLNGVLPLDFKDEI